MGLPKALLLVDGEVLIVAHVKAFAAVGATVTVVVGAHAEAVRAVLPEDVRVVENSAWATSDPARSAFLALTGQGDTFVMPVDVPPPTIDTLTRLLRVGPPAVPQFRGKNGHPALLGPPHILARLDVRTAGATSVAVDDADCVLNLNTPGDFAAWLAGRQAAR